MSFFATSFGIMLALILLEQAVLHWRHRREGKAHWQVPWRDIVSNLDSGHILMWVFRGMEVALFGWLAGHASLHLLDALPATLVWIFGLFAWDFSFYWMHRLHHRVPVLWRVHAIHHEGQHFNLSLGVRNAWYSSLTSAIFTAPLAILGLPAEIFVVVSSIHYSVQFYNHTALLGSSGWLERWLITPAHHRVHHAMAPIYLNRNFGGTFLCWDHWFGSFQAIDSQVPLVYGVRGHIGSDNPLWAHHPEARGLWHRLVHRVTRLWPAPHGVRTAAPRLDIPSSYIGVGGIALFTAVIHFVNQQGRSHSGVLLCLFALIFLGTLALGSLSEGRRSGLWGWRLLALPGVAATWWVQGPLDFWGCFSLSMWFAHGLTSFRPWPLAQRLPEEQDSSTLGFATTIAQWSSSRRSV
jgi:sterol desaturase/sphingolipid hydroxylase (fatty acid hydroxylase superfamily)